jgi:hypothetical protein
MAVRPFIIQIAEWLANFLIVFPLMIAFWRGVWQLMDNYSTKWNLDPWLSFGLGYPILFALYFLQESFKEHFDKSKALIFLLPFVAN